MKTDAIVQAWRQRPPREKWLLGVSAVVLVLAAGDILLTAPLDKRLQHAHRDTVALQARLPVAGLGGSANVLPGAEAAALRARETALRQRLQAAQAAAQSLHQQLADSARLPEVLRAITATVGSARVIELDLAGAADTPAADTAHPAPALARRLYRLPITLKVSGSWDELQTVLTEIETHAQALRWTSITLDAAQWPAIELTLKAHVLSLDPRWGASS